MSKKFQTRPELAVKDSFSFVEELKGLQNCGNYVMEGLIYETLYQTYQNNNVMFITF